MEQISKNVIQPHNIWPNLQGRIHVEGGRLTISRISLLDAGMYQCVSENEHGAIYASAELKVVGEYFFGAVLFTMNWTRGRDTLYCMYIVLPGEWKCFVSVHK